MSEALVTNYDEIAELKGQLAELRKNKDREIRQLEVAIYDGKKEAADLRQMLAEMHEVNAELHKDAQRLDWLQSNDLTLHSWEEGDVWGSKGAWTIREFIDREMEEQNYE